MPFVILALLLFIGVPSVHADDQVPHEAVSRNELLLPERRPVVAQGEVLPAVEFEITYLEGRVVLAGDPSATEPFWVDDHLLLEITRPDGTTVQWQRSFTPDCYTDRPIPPEDLTTLFQPGVNTVRVTISDECGAFVGPLGRLILSGVVVRGPERRQADWRLPATVLLAAPILLIAAARGLRAIRRRRRALIQKPKPAPPWKPGVRPVCTVEGGLIGIGREPLEPDGTYSGPLEFSRGPVTIGWGANCAIRVPEVAGVAEEHARLWLRGGRLTVHNRVPGYTTSVRGYPVIWDFVRTGDEFEVGPYRFRCIEAPEKQPASG